MQTLPVTSKFPVHPAPRHIPANHTEPSHQIAPSALVREVLEQPHAASAYQSSGVNPYTELDAMLIQDPNTGAIHGLRLALLFNAGLALSGLVIWELWSFLAS